MIHEKVYCNMSPIVIYGKFLGGSAGKDSVCNAGDLGFDPWVGKIPWRRERLPTPVFWPGESYGLYSPWGRKELDMTEQSSDTHYRETLRRLSISSEILFNPGNYYGPF